jgi:hypothetical protein
VVLRLWLLLLVFESSFACMVVSFNGTYGYRGQLFKIHEFLTVTADTDGRVQLIIPAYASHHFRAQSIILFW